MTSTREAEADSPALPAPCLGHGLPGRREPYSRGAGGPGLGLAARLVPCTGTWLVALKGIFKGP